jgi:integrase/recombinase XerD
MPETPSESSIGLKNTLVQKASSVWTVSVRAAKPESGDILALPQGLEEFPEWMQKPFRRFLRLKQRNWPAKTVQRSTRQIFNRLSTMFTFFLRQFEWQDWDQITPHWVEDYIDDNLRKGKTPNTINWDLNNFRVFCRFLMDEGHEISVSILRMKLLDTPHRLPRPLSADQVRRLLNCIQETITSAKTDRQLVLVVRDLACFYLLWQCGLRISEVCSLLYLDVDIEGRKLFIRNSKERKDRIVYMSDAVALALQQYLALLDAPNPIHVFPTNRGIMTPRTLQRRLVHIGQQCKVPVTAHRLRHTFASQMLTAGMPVTSLQRFLGHEHLDTTMVYAKVADPKLQQDYYQGILSLDPVSENMEKQRLGVSEPDILRLLVKELKNPGLDAVRREEIVDKLQLLLERVEKK